MSAITLPADIRWVTDELGVFVVEGDPLEDWHGDGGLTFVAPESWTRYDTACGSCRMLIEAHERLGTALTTQQAAIICESRSAELGKPHDCRDGRQVWTLRRPVRRNLADDPTPGWEWSADELLRATIQVVPVRRGFASSIDTPQGSWIALLDDGSAYLQTCDGVHLTTYPPKLPLDPLPTPGRDFAVIVRLTDD